MNSIKHSPLLMALLSHARELPDKVALIEDDMKVTYKELWDNVVAVADRMMAQGLKAGNKQLLMAQKNIGFVYRYFAAHYLGVVNVVVDPASTQERLDYIKSVISSNDSPVGDTADIMFTTGTTGNPKGVCLSHENIAASASNINAYIGNTTEDIEVLGLPLSHSFGLGRLRSVLLKGATIVLVGNFANVKVFFDAMERYKATGFGMVPAVWQYIRRLSGTRISKFASQLKYIEIGSAAMPHADKVLLIELFPDTRICMHYGLTEASRSFFMEFHSEVNDLTTIGRPVSDNMKVVIVGEDDSECDVNVDGEICVAGNHVMRSYLLPEDNKGAFWNGYFRTGDCGHKDNDGKYYLTGRKKEMINVGGKKVSPVLIEDAILSLGFPDCACVGVKDPKGILGEVPKVWIVRGQSNLTFEQIRTMLHTVLEPYEVPAAYEWIEKVPRTSSGKVQRLLLKQ